MAEQIEGLAALEKEFARLIRDIGPAGARGLQYVALDLWGRSANLAPIESGDLRGGAGARFDGKVIAQGDPGRGAEPSPVAVSPGANGPHEAEVGFYGIVYATVQHERLDYNHPKGGGPKFLETPFRENMQRYVDHVADEARQTWGG